MYYSFEITEKEKDRFGESQTTFSYFNVPEKEAREILAAHYKKIGYRKETGLGLAIVTDVQVKTIRSASPMESNDDLAEEMAAKVEEIRARKKTLSEEFDAVMAGQRKFSLTCAEN